MLEQLGLSNYENKVYTELLKSGTADARKISKESEVPYGRIYDVLNTLESKGLILKESGRPKKFTARNPEIAVSNLIEAKEREMEQLYNHAEKAKSKLKKIYDNKPEDGTFWKVAIGENMHTSYFSLLKESKYELLGYVELQSDTIENNLEMIERYGQTIKQLQNKGITIKLLIGIESFEDVDMVLEEMPQYADLFHSTNLRVTNLMTYPFTVIDNEKVILKVKNPAHKEEDLAAIYLWQESLAAELKSKFNTLWNEGKQLQFTAQ